ncbi:glycoside hydrolase family 16 protein [Mucilaginibacter glaciei]|uniref:Glycoside hydrolase family 16 protein n=1 Tax=Mucilaginibacter glaciei TaxID=2772109 RepID=A0A926NRQ0_9SPHI|nr:glycoside hydrolase family 16 protein [Mucilaginibacter glaciei]MBD1393782.1 glycoside hydrolase family 16 protein [Mucilaginibacter glaciei]
MKNIKTASVCLVAAFCFSACSKQATDTTKAPTITPVAVLEDKGWAFETTPYFADEFSVNGAPNTANWTYENGGGGWGNAELEYYTPANAVVADGKLTITAKKETMGGMEYTSTRIVSKGLQLAKYGRVEVKARLPKGTGIWPAIWMMPQDSKYGNWPNSGEIDIMEMVGFDPGNVHFTVHNQTYFGANGQGGAKVISSFNTDFHVYRVDWTPYALRGYIDGDLIYTYTNNGKGPATYPYDQNFFLILNVAVGGSWGGTKGVDNTIFPAAMDVDYVHFYKMIDK